MNAQNKSMNSKSANPSTVHNRAKEKDTPKDQSATAAKDTPLEDAGPKDDSPEAWQQKYENAIAESQQHYDRLLRVTAEFENFKKRTLRENEDFRKFANKSIILELLTVVDNLERAVQSTESRESKAVACVVEGVDMTLKGLLETLKKNGVEPIEALGQEFDPTFHQAVMQEESNEQPENTILKEFQKGYLLHQRLLRPAMVVVAKTAGNKNTTESTQPNSD